MLTTVTPPWLICVVILCNRAAQHFKSFRRCFCVFQSKLKTGASKGSRDFAEFGISRKFSLRGDAVSRICDVVVVDANVGVDDGVSWEMIGSDCDGFGDDLNPFDCCQEIRKFHLERFQEMVYIRSIVRQSTSKKYFPEFIWTKILAPKLFTE